MRKYNAKHANRIMVTKLIHGDCLKEMPKLQESSIDLILCDPPYFKVKGNAWDNQWGSKDNFIQWLEKVSEQWCRLLKSNGSLYCFASSKMAAHVEVMLSEKFNVVNSIVWAKPSGLYMRHDKGKLRSYAPQTERIIFCEHYGSDNAAKGEAGYVAKCDELRGFVFEPLRIYFAEEKKQCGISRAKIKEGMKRLTGRKYMFDQHTFSKSQWQLPTQEQYSAAMEVFREFCGHDCLRREYEGLRREYEGLRREYEGLRRPFNVRNGVNYTDVWDFPVVQDYPGKHPCEKPLSMLNHIIKSSSIPGASVLDSFCGTGNTGIACHRAGRNFIGIELDKEYFKTATNRINAAIREPVQGVLFPDRD